MITERTLKVWRMKALKVREFDPTMYKGSEVCEGIAKGYKEQAQCILRLTQELQDIYMMRVIK
jgi:hypothetical protein